VHINNPCFLQASNLLKFSYGSGLLSVELPSLTFVGEDFVVTAQTDITRVVLPELRIVQGTVEISLNPLLTFLSVPKIISVSSIYVCSLDAEAFLLPSYDAGTWPKTELITIQDENSRCIFGSDECGSSVSCKNFPW
jgi:hypothetical protein